VRSDVSGTAGNQDAHTCPDCTRRAASLGQPPMTSAGTLRLPFATLACRGSKPPKVGERSAPCHSIVAWRRTRRA
jgi:hypothetical protein